MLMPQEKMMEFNNAWVGYDLPYESVENQPGVQMLRKAGIEKRIKTPEFHVTLGFFANVNLDVLENAIKAAQNTYGQSLRQTTFNFDGYGVIDHEQGRYVYFSPDQLSATEAFFLKDSLVKNAFYDKEKNCVDLHLSVGGPDPFDADKPKMWPLNNPFSSEGRLVFVGNDGKRFRKFFWQGERFTEEQEAETAKNIQHSTFNHGNNQAKSETQRSVSNEPVAVKEAKAINKIALFPKIQADTAVAYYILTNFGEALFPGIKQADVVFWTALPEGKTAEQVEADGCLAVDLGGMFDHHKANEKAGKRDDCVSGLIARYLGVENDVTLKKMLAWAKRDDLQGKGTMSTDTLDRAFGLSGVIMNANREYASDPKRALDLIVQILDLHAKEERRRQVELPQELDSLEKAGKVDWFNLRQGSADLKAAYIQTDNIAMAGFLRAAKKMDLIIQQRTSGHANVITQQIRSIDLRPLAAVLRMAEADKKGLRLKIDEDLLMAAGRMEGVDEWYYDDAANSIQNGGINPGDIQPTRLSRPELIALVKDAIPLGRIGTLKTQKEQGR